jgi:uncharacterized linocin/CFP29 family protein
MPKGNAALASGFTSSPAQIDFITPGGNGLQGSGSVAQRLLQSGFKASSLRSNLVLRKDEWILLDRAIVQIARTRLIGVGDLVSRGLTYPIANALGVTRLEWQTMSDITPAEVSMSGIKEAEYDRPEFALTGMPIPIIHKDFTINLRTLESSRRSGQPLDTVTAALAGRVVAEKTESILFSGYTGLGTNNLIYGYTTAPQRNTGSVSASWATATGTQIVTDVLAMIQKAVDDNMYGPYVLYVPASAFTHMGDDFKANSDRTILERILAIPGISAIRPTKDLAAPNVILVQMTSDVIELIDGIQPMMVEWESHGGFVMHFKILAIMVPRIRNDQANQSGIVHYS